MINKHSQYKTASGHAVCIYHIYVSQDMGVHGAYRTLDNRWVTCEWSDQGIATDPSLNLIPENTILPQDTFVDGRILSDEPNFLVIDM